MSELLTEIERQQKYLDELPTNFTYPLFNSRKALESQRKSGYRNTASAAREIVDNAIEAHAGKVHIIFDTPGGSRKSGERKKGVSSVAFIDDGAGMLPTMARFALSWGGGTHFNDSDFIGRFGFGLPNASINQTRRVEVYTRTSASEPITKAWLDIDEYTGEGSSQDIAVPVVGALPDFVQRYLDRMGWEFSHGTIVVWVRPDHLSYRSTGSLKDHLLDDFGVTYRYLLKDFELKVEGVTVEPVDPMFLDPKSRFYREPSAGGAICQYEETIPVRLVEDPQSGEQQLARVTNTAELSDDHLVAAGSIHLRVSRMPLGLVVGAASPGIEPVDEHSRARFEIRKSRRGMTFVRAGREIETVDVFPRRATDIASGLGDWPLLQSYAYHWGIEVKFTPTLDDVFGIANDKQRVSPIEGFWRLLVKERIDDLLNRENAHQAKERTREAKQRRSADATAKTDGPSPAQQAAQSADAALGVVPVVPDREKAGANLNLEQKAAGDAKQLNKSIEEAREALKSSVERRPYEIEYGDDGNDPFYTPRWVGTQIMVRVNRNHPFFTTLYDAVIRAKAGLVAKEAIDMLLFTLARAELDTRNPQTKEFYLEQRSQVWSGWLAAGLRSLERSLPPAEDDDLAA